MQKFAILLASGVAVIVVATAVGSAGADKSSDAKPSPTVAAAPKAPTKESKTEGDTVPQPPLKSLEGFRACIQQKGMVADKTASTHVTRLSNMDDWNGILDNPKIWTNYVGGLAAHAAEGNVLASVFAECYSSTNGLVTVYDADGHVMGTGQF